LFILYYLFDINIKKYSNEKNICIITIKLYFKKKNGRKKIIKHKWYEFFLKKKK